MWTDVRGGWAGAAPSLAHEPSQARPGRQPVARRSTRPDDRPRPDHHAGRLRGARDLDGHADRRRRARRARAVRLGLLGVLPRLADRHRRRRRRDRPRRAGDPVRDRARRCSRSACSSAASRRRCRSWSAPGSSRASAPARSSRSPTSRSDGRCPSRSGRGCSPRCRRPGSCPASSARRIAGTVGEIDRLAVRLPGPAAAHRAGRRADARRAARDRRAAPADRRASRRGAPAAAACRWR